MERKQWADASKRKGYDKNFYPYHMEGDRPVRGKGGVDWGAYRFEEAFLASAHGNNKPVISQEGETCVELGRSVPVP
jgi:hypothetical protein